MRTQKLKPLFLDLGGTKTVVASKKTEDLIEIEELLNLKSLKEIKLEGEGLTLRVYESKNVKNKIHSLFSLKFKFYISIAGVPFYEGKKIKVLSARFGNFVLSKDKFFVLNDVKSFAFYWANYYDNLLAVQLGTGVNGYFYNKSLLKDFDYLLSFNELGDLKMQKRKAYDWLGGKKNKLVNSSFVRLLNRAEDLFCFKLSRFVDVYFYKKRLVEFLTNLSYLYPFENVVLGGGMVKKLDFSTNKLGYRKIKEFKIIKGNDFIYNIKGLLLARETFDL